MAKSSKQWCMFGYVKFAFHIHRFLPGVLQSKLGNQIGKLNYVQRADSVRKGKCRAITERQSNEWKHQSPIKYEKWNVSCRVIWEGKEGYAWSVLIQLSERTIGGNIGACKSFAKTDRLSRCWRVQMFVFLCTTPCRKRAVLCKIWQSD